MSDEPRNPEDRTTEIIQSSAGLTAQIGPYRIIQKVGEGGMGEVYEAEQAEPVRRRVALKLIKAGMDSKEVIARFESERQALALMNHPSIARVFDAGTTDQGRPYFAMEYVKGEPISWYCDRHRLTTSERLRLFMQVCDGVQHAHHKGVIHRDIKPSNVLVTMQDESPVPKIIDFGVAKATAQRLTERSLFTELGQIIGTPEYMSPEQAEMTGLDIDTRTDVYSLGVLLYELLVGALPFDIKALRKAGFDEIRRKIREDEPSRPSTRISTLGDSATKTAKLRRTSVQFLRRELSGDLDWITMMALEKDRARRYASPSNLAADLERHLRDEPVVAGPPSRAYRMGKFIKRHRVGVTAASLVLVASLAGLAAATYGMVQARRAEAEAEHVSEFLVGLFEVSDPSEARGNSITAREILDKGAEKIEQELGGQPLVQARLMATMGDVYRRLGLYSRAEPLLRGALESRREVLGDDHIDTVNSTGDLWALHYEQGKLDEGEIYLRESLEARRRLLPEDHPDLLTSLSDMGALLVARGRLDEAEPYLRETLARRRRTQGNDHRETLGSIRNMGVLLHHKGKLTEVEPYYREALEGARRTLGDDHPDTLGMINAMASLLLGQGKLDEAPPYVHEALETSRKVLGDEHPETLDAASRAGRLLRNQGKLDEAEPYYREVLQARRRILGNDHLDTLRSIGALATLFRNQDKLDEAEPLQREALERRRRTMGDDHPETLTSINSMGILLDDQGKPDEAEPYYREALEGRRRVLGENHPDTLASLHNMGFLLQNQGRLEEAEVYYRASLDGKSDALGDDHLSTLISRGNLGDLLRKQGKLDEAEPMLAAAVRDATRSLSRTHYHTGIIIRKHGRCLTEMRRYDEAEAALLEAHRILLDALGNEHAQTQKAIPDLVDLYEARGMPGKAAEWRAKLPEAGNGKVDG